ncbi:MAG: FUN14 domain-containing protein [Trueperaceae bacterium]
MNVPDLQSVLPWVQQIGFGAVAGFVAGYALKKVGKLVALAIGLLFIVIQLLAWWGFLSVDWGVVQKTVDPLLESESLNQAWRSLVTVLTYNIPFAAAFVPAMVLGIRRG